MDEKIKKQIRIKEMMEESEKPFTSVKDMPLKEDEITLFDYAHESLVTGYFTESENSAGDIKDIREKQKLHEINYSSMNDRRIKDRSFTDNDPVFKKDISFSESGPVPNTGEKNPGIREERPESFDLYASYRSHPKRETVKNTGASAHSEIKEKKIKKKKEKEDGRELRLRGGESDIHTKKESTDLRHKNSDIYISQCRIKEAQENSTANVSYKGRRKKSAPGGSFLKSAFSELFRFKTVMKALFFVTVMVLSLSIVLSSAATLPTAIFDQSDEVYLKINETIDSIFDDFQTEFDLHLKGECKQKEIIENDETKIFCKSFKADEINFDRESFSKIDLKTVLALYCTDSFDNGMTESTEKETVSGSESEESFSPSQSSEELKNHFLDMDDKNREKLKEIFFYLYSIICTKSERRDTYTSFDSKGRQVTREKITVIRNISLYDVDKRVKSFIDERFSDEKKSIYIEITGDKYNDLWQKLYEKIPAMRRSIYYDDISSSPSGKIAEIALREYEESRKMSPPQGRKYWSYFNAPAADWCAYFCGYCIKEAGIDPDKVGFSPAIGENSYWGRYAKDRNLFYYANDRSFTPSPGDILVCNGFGHVEVIVEVDGDLLYCVGGNERSNSFMTSVIGYDTYHRRDSYVNAYINASKFDIPDFGDTLKNALRIYSFFKSEGFDETQIRGIIGNFACEGTLLDPTSIEDIFDEPFSIGEKKKQAIASDFLNYGSFYHRYDGIFGNGKGKAGIGLAGWTGTNNIELINFSKDVGGQWYDFALQIAYSAKFYSNTGWLYSTYKNTRYYSTDQATYDFMVTYERPAGDGHISNRQYYAKKLLSDAREKYGSSIDQSFVNRVNQYIKKAYEKGW